MAVSNSRIAYHVSTEAALSAAEVGGGRRETFLVSADSGGASNGMVAAVEYEPGAVEHAARRNEIETAMLVLTGEISIESNTGHRLATADAFVWIPAGTDYHLTAGPQGARVIVIYGGAATPAQLTDQSHAADPAKTESEIVIKPAQSVEDNPFHQPAQGFHHMSARWLVDENLGSVSLVLGQSTFAPDGGVHALHRHPHAEEFFLVLEGEGEHLTKDDGAVALSAGDITFARRQEWHGARNTGQRPMKALFGYLGVNSLEAGGYQLP
jgi:quercetin dioxygenase-like cupin family protein